MCQNLNTRLNHVWKIVEKKKTIKWMSLVVKCFIIKMIVIFLGKKKIKDHRQFIKLSMICIYDWKTPRGAVRHGLSLDTDTCILSLTRITENNIVRYHTSYDLIEIRNASVLFIRKKNNRDNKKKIIYYLLIYIFSLNWISFCFVS